MQKVSALFLIFCFNGVLFTQAHALERVIQISNGAASPGNTTVLELGMDQVQDFAGGDFEIYFDSAFLHIVDVEALYGVGIQEAARLTHRGRGKPCSVCGLVKRHVMNRVTRDGGYDVLATGHNLDDEAATLFGNTLHWQVGYLSRQAPVLPETSQGLARKVKPFFRFYERETAAYALISGIDYIYEECPFSVGASSIHHKTALNELEIKSPGTKLQFYLGFLRTKKAGLFEGLEHAPPEMYPCRTCGQPTTAGDQCAFCRFWNQVNERRGKG